MTKTERLASQLEKAAAAELGCHVEGAMEQWRSICESPIEMAFLAAFQFWYAMRIWSGQPLTFEITKQPPKDNQPFGLIIVPQYQFDKYRVDFAFFLGFCGHRPVLFVECDGLEFHSSQDQIWRDGERNRAAMKAGIAVFRFTGRELHQDPLTCVHTVVKHLVNLAREDG